MKFGIDYFPDAHPGVKPGSRYFEEALDLVEYADELGYDSVKIVEHYFMPYGGSAPDPCRFLAAASQRARRMRLVTGAVLPVFNHPLKLAGQLTMLDAISGGRLDVGIARAFLPYEFDAFGISMEERRARFEDVAKQLTYIRDTFGEVYPSFQINFGMMEKVKARRSIELFAKHVMPQFR